MEIKTQKNIVIGLLEVPKPMITLGVALPMLDLKTKYFTNTSNHWRRRNMSDKQVEYMKSFGVLVTPNDKMNFNQGDACDTIDALVHRQDQRARLQYHLNQASKLLEVSRD